MTSNRDIVGVQVGETLVAPKDLQQSTVPSLQPGVKIPGYVPRAGALSKRKANAQPEGAAASTSASNPVSLDLSNHPEHLAYLAGPEQVAAAAHVC